MVRRVDTMRAVVAWLQLADAEALGDLRALETAVNEICAQLRGVCEDARRLQQEVELLLAAMGHSRPLAGLELAPNVTEHVAALWRVAAACGEIQRGIQSWGLGGLEAIRGEDVELEAISAWRKKLS